MSDTSARLALPYLQPAQAQKHVTHNAALARLDVLVQLSVEGFDAQTPPADPAEGAVWGLGAAPGAAWDGQAGALAAFVDGGWLFFAPGPGWRAWDKGTGALFVYTGAVWANVSGVPDLDNLAGVGINTGSDPINRLAVAAQATLLSHDGAGHQVKVNKAATGDTASLLFQSGFSGRAEMGLAGNNDFSIRTSPDGSAFTTGLRVRASDGVTVAKAITGVQVSVADDAVVSVPTPSVNGFVMVCDADPTSSQATNSGIFVYDTGSTPWMITMSRGSTMQNRNADILTGTTGPDGNISLSAGTGALTLENRFGSTRSCSLTFIGG